MADLTLAEARAQLAALEAEYATAAAEANRLRAEADALRQASDEAAARAAGVAHRARSLADIVRREDERPGPDCPELAPIFDGYDVPAHVVRTVAGVIKSGPYRGCFEVEWWAWQLVREGLGWVWDWCRTVVIVHPTGVPRGRRKPRIDPEALAQAAAKCAEVRAAWKAAAREVQP